MKIRKDLECFIRLFYLIVHYELKSDTDLMISLFKSTYRFLYKRNTVYEFENILLDFLKKKSPKLTTQKETIAAFAELKNKFIKLSKDPFENKAFYYFDFISWLESKIEKKTLAEIIQRKAGTEKGRSSV